MGRNSKLEEIPESREMHECRSESDFQVRGNYKMCEVTVSQGICKSAQNDEVKFLVNLLYD